MVNLESTAIPIARTVSSTLSIAGGIHVRISPDRSDHILIEFFDIKGINITKGAEKKSRGLILRKICGGL